MKNFNGKVLFLDRSDINTDEIIPARYLTEVTKEALKPFLLEDLEMEGFSWPADIQEKRAVVTRENFGCGSSREHAPWALEINGIHLVIAENFARIFRQNMFNCGMLAIELSKEDIEEIFSSFSGKKTELKTNFDNGTLTFSETDSELTVNFTLSGFDSELVKAGGWVNFADKNY